MQKKGKQTIKQKKKEIDNNEKEKKKGNRQ